MTLPNQNAGIWERGISVGNFIVATIALCVVILGIIVQNRVQATQAEDRIESQAADLKRVETKMDLLSDRLEGKIDKILDKQSDQAGAIRELNSILKEEGKKH